MFSLDPRSIILVSTGLYFLLGGVMVLFSASLRHQRGPAYWAAGTCSFAFSSFLLPFRDILPDWLTIVVSNQGMVVSTCLVAHGLAQHLGQAPRWAYHLVVCLANLVGIIYFCHVVPSFSARVIVFSLSTVALTSEMAQRLLPRVQNSKDPARLLMLFTLLAGILFYVIRAVYHSVHFGVGLMEDTGFNVVSLLFFPLNVIALGFGFMAMAGSGYARRMDAANKSLAETNSRLQEALDNVKTLSGLLPICAHCKKIRDDQGYWQQIEGYLREHTDADFTHGICPACAHELYGDYIKSRKVG